MRIARVQLSSVRLAVRFEPCRHAHEMSGTMRPTSDLYETAVSTSVSVTASRDSTSVMGSANCTIASNGNLRREGGAQWASSSYTECAEAVPVATARQTGWSAARAHEPIGRATLERTKPGLRSTYAEIVTEGKSRSLDVPTFMTVASSFG